MEWALLEEDLVLQEFFPVCPVPLQIHVVYRQRDRNFIHFNIIAWYILVQMQRFFNSSTNCQISSFPLKRVLAVCTVYFIVHCIDNLKLVYPQAAIFIQWKTHYTHTSFALLRALITAIVGNFQCKQLYIRFNQVFLFPLAFIKKNVMTHVITELMACIIANLLWQLVIRSLSSLITFDA